MGSSLLLKGGTSNPKNLVESISTASPHGFVVGDVVRFDTATSLWTKAQANSAENSEVAGVVSAVTNATEFDVTYSGYISITSLAGVTSPVLFLDSTAAGGLTASPPSAIGMVVKPVLTKTTNGSGYIVSNYIGTQIGGSSTVAIDEIQPVGTIMPFAGSAIPDSWLACDGASYAVSAYPNLYAKMQNSSGDRVPAYGYVVEIGVNTTTSQYATWLSLVTVGDTILYDPTQSAILQTTVTTYALIGRVLAKGTASVTVQVFPKYDLNTKNFVVPNVIPSTVGWLAAFAPVANNTIYDFLNSTNRRGDAASAASAQVYTVSVTHFNTPDLRGRFAIGTNTTRLPAINDLEGDGANYSAISAIYSMGSQGGEEKNSLPAISVATSGSAGNALANVSTNLLNNIPPYTVVRYIIKATPYTRAAIIDGIDIPYTSLLVGDLRDGSLRPGGSGEDLLFKTNNGTSGIERMRLTNAGNLGIGTTTPVYKFVVSNSGAEGFEFIPANTSGVNIIQSYNRSGGVFNTIDFRASDYKVRVGNTEILTINSTGQVNIASAAPSTSVNTGGLTLGGGLGVGGAIYASTVNATATTPSTTVATGALTVAGGLGVAGGINAAGLTAITVNATGLSKLSRTSVFNGSSDLNSNYVFASKATAQTSGAVLGYANLANNSIYGILGHADAYSFYGAGDIYTSGDITAFSDIRSKENISTIENALDKTLTLNGVLYTDKETQQRRTGLIAQDVLSILPEAVRTNTDGYYALAYGNLVGLLVQAIKELNAKVDALSEKVNSLGGTA